tara:strand:+ start:124 stop:360 length:237 start_codon:yes stop_codon:yes gene_type:complete
MKIIEISNVLYRCLEFDNLYGIHLQANYKKPNGVHYDNNWVDVEDLTELKILEYNKLVDELGIHYPDYTIEHLEGRFI